MFTPLTGFTFKQQSWRGVCLPGSSYPPALSLRCCCFPYPASSTPPCHQIILLRHHTTPLSTTQVMVAPGSGANGSSTKVDPNWTFLKLFKDIDVADVDMLLPGEGGW